MDMEVKSQNQTFGQTIRALREKQQITLRKFANKVGMSPTYLSKVERDELAPPGEKKVLAIAEALNQDRDKLLALAGRVASELPEIIKKKPREMALLLRVAKDLSKDQLVKLSEQAEKLKQKH